MSNVKQVIVIRHDLQMRMGKAAAQAAHASMAFLSKRVFADASYREYDNRRIGTIPIQNPLPGYNMHKFSRVPLSDAEHEWLRDKFTKICLRVDSEEELHDIYGKAVAAELLVHIIKDSGLTEFKEPTFTCLAIGPDYAENIDPITGHLKLM